MESRIVVWLAISSVVSVLYMVMDNDTTPNVSKYNASMLKKQKQNNTYFPCDYMFLTGE